MKSLALVRTDEGFRKLYGIMSEPVKNVLDTILGNGYYLKAGDDDLGNKIERSNFAIRIEDKDGYGWKVDLCVISFFMQGPGGISSLSEYLSNQDANIVFQAYSGKGVSAIPYKDEIDKGSDMFRKLMNGLGLPPSIFE